MTTSCINDVHSHMSYKCNTLNQLSNLHSSRTLNDLKMAPQDKNTGTGVMKMELPDEQYPSNESSSPENNSNIQTSYEEAIKKSRQILLSSLPLNVKSPLKQHESLEYAQSFVQNGRKISCPTNGLNKPSGSTVNGSDKLLCDELYRCFKCDFIGRNDDELPAHALKHDPYECSSCGFMANTADNLKMHLKDDHPEIAPDSWDDIIIFHEPAESTSGRKKKTKTVEWFIESFLKPRKTPCRLCNNFVGKNKMDYFQHLRDDHSDCGRLLPCDLCPFIALYKHHLEYHFRNHFGSKPFMCDRCDYDCVNRSMLNSHYKSHSNIYQYACKNCSYLTKYLHSLKMHLRKYNHEPGRILNSDGSINTTTIIDVHGKRRGPKSKKRKSETDLSQENSNSPKSKSSPSPPSSLNQTPSQNIRILYNPHIYNNYTGNLYMRSEPSDYRLHSSPNSVGYSYKCGYCDFISESYSIYHFHLLSHFNQNQARNGNFDPNYPYYVSPQNMDYLFNTHYGADSFPKNSLNQSTFVDKRKMGGNQEMNAPHNDIQFQNSSNAMNCGPLGNSPVNKEDSSDDEVVIPPNGFQHPKMSSGRLVDNGTKTSTPSPKEMSPLKDEIPETTNGLWTTLENSSVDVAPLDLSVNKLQSPEAKRNGEASPHDLQSMDLTMNLTPSVSPKSGNESKATTTLKANRRKGKAFKLNQYIIESDPTSDGIETESGLVKSPKAAIGCEIRNSVPRINFKPALNTAKWNGHNSYESSQSEFQSKMGISTPIPNHLQPDSTETMDNVPTMKKQRISDVSKDSWCSSCSMDQGSAYLLQIHSSYHSEDDPFTCAKCGLRCHVKDVFIHHLIAGSRINGKCINAIEYES